MTDETEILAQARTAWSRLRRCTSYNDWLSVARALALGRAHAMAVANTNRPFGFRYNAAVGQWLTANGLAGINGQERFAALRLLDRLDDIEVWRATLDDVQRRRLNHPNAIWSHFRRHERATADSADAPQRNIVRDGGATRGRFRDRGRAVHWPQDAIARAADAIHDARSADCIVMARVALEAAVRGAADIEELLADRPQLRPLPPRPRRHVAEIVAAP